MRLRDNGTINRLYATGIFNANDSPSKTLIFI